MDAVLFWINIAGVAVFAATGALAASRKQMDIFGFMLAAAVTGVGGGTLRDLLLGIQPVFWVAAPLNIAVCLATAVVLFFTVPFFESRYRVLLWADAVGLALFAVAGTETALKAGAHGLVAVVMGVLTATFGGIVRDLLCAEVPLILRREIYATAAAAGALVFVGMRAAEAEPALATLCGFLAGFAVRAVGIGFGVSFPAYRGRPGRDY